MQWYHYFGGFWAGMFLANFVPHYIKGVSGDKFPTPFAKPPGKGLSSPIVNVAWALFNLVVGYVLYRSSKVTTEDTISIVTFFAGIACMSLMLGNTFAKKDRE